MSRADEVIAELRTAPEGLTTMQVATRLHVPEYTISSVLSKLGCYGKIDKYKVGLHGKTIWRVKPDAYD